MDLRLTRGYAWMTIALNHMYEQLGYVSYANTKQLVGYLSLLRVSLNEHYYIL